MDEEIIHYEFTEHLIKSSYELKQLDEFNYHRLLGMLLDSDDEDLEKLIIINKELVNALADNELEKISGRLVAGATLIEAEQDPVKKRQYMAVYEQLYTKMQKLIESKSA